MCVYFFIHLYAQTRTCMLPYHTGAAKADTDVDTTPHELSRRAHEMLSATELCATRGQENKKLVP